MLNLIVPSVVYNINFLKLWGAQILTQVALNMLYYILTIWVWESTHSNTAVGALILSFGIPAVIFGPFAGVLVDRWDTRMVIVGTNLLRTLMLPLFALALNVPPTVFVLTLAISFVTQFFIPAEGSSIPALVKKDQLISANSLFTLSLNTSMAVGYLMASPFLRVLGNNGTIFVIFFCFLVATIITERLPRIPGLSGGKGFSTVIAELMEGGKFIFANRTVRSAILSITLFQSLVLILASLGPGFAASVLKVAVVDVSIIVLAPAIAGVVVGTLVLPRLGKRWPERFLITIGIISGGILLASLGLLRADLWNFDVTKVAMTILFFLGVANSFVNVPATTMIHKLVPSDLRGRVYGIVNMLISGVAFLPLLIVGGLADVFGVSLILVLIGFFVFFLGLYRLRRGVYTEKEVK
ncbi:MAG: MFS transporter [Patescibacteria group bacterium]|nr:MFS transporter [Patescibacteria group bacterium]